MTTTLRKALTSAALLLSITAPLAAQPAKTPLSPSKSFSKSYLNKDGSMTTISVEYAQPSMRGRKIMGELVPYGKVWRTGANAATVFAFNGGDLMIGNTRVPAGNYTLYTLPEGPNKWTLIINKQTGQWGTVYDASKDLVRIPLQLKKLSAPQETMSISLDDNVAITGGELHIRWESTDASVTVATAPAK